MARGVSEAQNKLGSIPEAPWIRRMRAHYTKTGSYRPQDLKRLLGDLKKRVTMGSAETLSRYFKR